jgi:hypothetical protein
MYTDILHFDMHVIIKIGSYQGTNTKYLKNSLKILILLNVKIYEEAKNHVFHYVTVLL